MRLKLPRSVLPAAAGLLAGYIRGVRRGTDFVILPPDAARRIAEDGPFILATWHGQNMLLPAFLDISGPSAALASRSFDGEIVARTLERFGIASIRGAGGPARKQRQKGGASALRNMVRTLGRGLNVVTTADMPPGPARSAGPGIVTLARLAGRPILPVAILTDHGLTLNNWSRYRINLPFGHGALVCGAPVHVPRQLDEAGLKHRQDEVTAALDAAARRAGDLLARGRRPWPLPLYAGFMNAARLAAPLFLRWRARHGKEERARLAERSGRPSRKRPTGRLIWLHGASIGESLAVLPLIGRFLEADPQAHVLVTTGTVTSARIMATRLPERAIHQFMPLDIPRYTGRFLDHWRPDLAVFVESELWPNLLHDISRRGIALALVNGRMTERSFSRWRRSGAVAASLLGRFDLILAQSRREAERFSALGGRQVRVSGNLKYAAPPPPVNADDLAALRRQIGRRPLWLAASTHPGEEIIIARAHARLTKEFPSLLTIIIPRHPGRGREIAGLLLRQGLQTARRSSNEAIAAVTPVYIADTIGETGLFFSLADCVFMGGSLVPHGGQNPAEAALLDSAILHGQHVFNFKMAYEALARTGGARQINEDNLAEQLGGLLADKARRHKMAAAARRAMASLGGALDTTFTALDTLQNGDRHQW